MSCGGASETLHVHSISENSWAQCASTPDSPRGGTFLVTVGSVLLRFGGFNGQELGGGIDVFDPSTNTWTTRPYTKGLGNKSVATFLPHPSFLESKAILVFGEKSPSNDGHNAARTFWSDIWIHDFAGETWDGVTIENAQLLNEGGMGWGAGAVIQRKDPAMMVIWGGLNERNE
jgi:hypothetical protein